MLRKKFGISRHEPRLADGGTGLQFGEFRRAFFKSERAHAGANRAAGHKNNFPAGLFLRSDLRDELFQLRRINLFPAVGQHARAEFDDQPGGGFEQVALHTAD